MIRFRSIDENKVIPFDGFDDAFHRLNPFIFRGKTEAEEAERGKYRVQSVKF